MKTVIENKENWKKNAPPLKPEEEGLNLHHLERLNYNPYYYTPNEDDLNIDDEIVIGTSVSDINGNPTIKWTETRVMGLPLIFFYRPYVTCRKLIK